PTEKHVVDADKDIRAQVQTAEQKPPNTLREEHAAQEPKETRLKDKLPQNTHIVKMPNTWALDQINHTFTQLARIHPTMQGL
ncbi:Zn(II)/Cd(II)/Pb(II) translocating P-type ATPase ZntA, partial [Escherichia marmotae]|nr:Zn(II)/Cd(II)/Pb(II) translocating P-type ATPase ZntA [Escherichia marmotae]